MIFISPNKAVGCLRRITTKQGRAKIVGEGLGCVRGDFMSVYAIAQLWIHDPVTYKRYVDRFMEIFKKYKGRVLVADESPVIVEGTWDGDKVVVVSFPNEASFRDWAESPDYLEIAKDRKAGAKSVIVLVKGIANHD
jgi:uncharacterized protein (DUF1330 family)